MATEVISVGEQLRCAACGHERTVTAHWLSGVGKRYLPGREPMVLRTIDLKRFKCSSCGEKRLKKSEAHIAQPIQPKAEPDSQARKLAIAVVDQASILERQVLLNWAQQLVAIRDSNLSAMEKAKASISATVESKAIWPFLNVIGRELKRLGWDERGFAARIGLSAAALALLIPGKGAAGIAALGGAIGVPLWVVFGAGGAFVGVIVQEINKQTPPVPPTGSYGRVSSHACDISIQLIMVQSKRNLLRYSSTRKANIPRGM